VGAEFDACLAVLYGDDEQDAVVFRHVADSVGVEKTRGEFLNRGVGCAGVVFDRIDKDDGDFDAGSFLGGVEPAFDLLFLPVSQDAGDVGDIAVVGIGKGGVILLGGERRPGEQQEAISR